MRKNILFVLLLVLVMMSIGLGTILAQEDDGEPADIAEQAEETTEDVEDSVSLFEVNSETIINARISPSTVANVAGLLQPGEVVEVVEIVEGSLVGGNSIWYRILIGDDDAFVHSLLLSPVSETQNQGVVVDVPDSYLPSIIVNSTGSVTVSPNLAIMQFGFEQVGTDTASVYRATQTAQSNVVAALIAEGISEDDLTATFVTIINEDVLDPAGGITGEFVFRTEALLTVYIDDLDQIPNVIDAALTNGANSIQNLVYTLDDFTPAEDQAILNGLERSLENARNIAEESFILLGPSVAITVSPFTVTTVEDLVNSPLNQNRIVNRQVPMVPDQLVVSVEISVTYGIRTR